MAEITRLAVQKRDRERVNVYLDGEFAFGLTLMEAIHLKIGQQLTEREIEALRNEDDYHRAYNQVLDLLSRRPRSEREVRQYMARKEVAPEHQDRIVQRLLELRFLDDGAFARYWIENRDAFRPRGSRALSYELRQKGVDETIIREALADTDVDDAESAYRAALKLLPRLRAIEDRREFQKKLAGALGRRGYSWGTIRTVADQLWQQRHDETEPD